MTFNIAIAGTGSIADDQLAPALAQVEDAQLWSVLSRAGATALALRIQSTPHSTPYSLIQNWTR